MRTTTRHTHATAAAIASLALLASPAAAEKIKEIAVDGNSKTTDDTVILAAGIEVGDNFDTGDITEAEARLVDSGLFKDVDVFTTPHPDGGVKVTIVAKDKHSWAIAPTVYVQPTNKGGGFGFGENNLFGQNKKILLYGQYATGDTFFVGAYVDPAIRGSRFRWQLDTYLARIRTIEYEAPTEWYQDMKPVRHSKMRYLNTGISLGVNLFRKTYLDIRVRGAEVAYSDVELDDAATEEDLGLLPGDPIPAPGSEGWDISVETRLEFDRIANWYGVFHGDRVRLYYERAPHRLSDFDYWHTGAEWVLARKFFSKHNLVLRSKINYGQNLPFQQEFTTGGTAMRGFKNEHLRGDLVASGNLEYSLQIFNVKGFALRGLVFWDSAYTAFLDNEPSDAHRNYLPNHGDLGLAPLKNTVGLGTRIYIRQIVLPLLGLDFGYGLERNAYEIYFAIGLTDL